MIHKVKSHVDSLGVQDHVQAFIHLGNEIADAAAKQAIGTIPLRYVKKRRSCFRPRKMTNARWVNTHLCSLDNHI